MWRNRAALSHTWYIRDLLVPCTFHYSQRLINELNVRNTRVSSLEEEVFVAKQYSCCDGFISINDNSVTTYRHRRRRRRDENHSHNAHTGNAPVHKHSHSHSLACYLANSCHSGREDHPRIHTFEDRRTNCPSSAGPAPVRSLARLGVKGGRNINQSQGERSGPTSW